MAQTDLPETGSSPQTPGPADDAHSSSDYQIQVASRVSRLPPYMFGRINALLYEKRRAGHD
ncbi:MAG: aminotransferase, partial [Planctomycetaceae bacterium]|nr:aminotransferase [Planctomycetaceae bacterium]